jgi:hypothetical protein
MGIVPPTLTGYRHMESVLGNCDRKGHVWVIGNKGENHDGTATCVNTAGHIPLGNFRVHPFRLQTPTFEEDRGRGIDVVSFPGEPGENGAGQEQIHASNRGPDVKYLY